MPDPTLLNGAYRLIRSVDSGATARVYLAEEVATGTKVAVKLLRRELMSQPEFVSRFEREATLLKQLNHPNLVRLIRLVKGPEGLFLLLEWVEGKRLDHFIHEHGQLSGAEALAVLTQVARALAALHTAGIVHRDLKPENVMIEHTPQGLVARLLDLGIARFSDPNRAASTFQTLQGHVAGTPTYLSPEQIMAKPAAATADVYSFGVLAYFVLAGHPPFQDVSQLGLMQQHLSEKPPKLVPTDDSLAKHPIVALVMHCLQKAEADRPLNGAALVAELEAPVDTTAKKKSWWPKAKR